MRAVTSSVTMWLFGISPAKISHTRSRANPPNRNEPPRLAMIRLPAVAGRFYPDDPASLCAAVDSFLANGGEEKKIRARACLVPHAGYMYSGSVAGEVYRRIDIPARVILLGPRHFPRGAPLAILSDGAWQTPLGIAPIDHLLAEKIVRAFPLLREDAVAHSAEHSLEAQLLFLHRPPSFFLFLPIVIGPA